MEDIAHQNTDWEIDEELGWTPNQIALGFRNKLVDSREITSAIHCCRASDVVCRMGDTGFEPVTSSLSEMRSNQLS